MYNYIIIGLLIFFIIIIYVYLIVKDNETNKKFYLYEKAIENLNKKIFDLEKNKQTKDIEEYKEYFQNYIDEKLKEDIQNITVFVLNLKKEIDNELSNAKNDILKQIEYISEKIKNFASMQQTYQTNDKKIISLYNEGFGVNEIARKLRIGIGEVELVLKLAGIK